MCRRRGCGGWRNRCATRNSPRAALPTVTTARPGSRAGSAVPLAAFKFAHGGPSIETPPPEFGADTDDVLAEYGYAPAEIAAFRRDRVI